MPKYHYSIAGSIIDYDSGSEAESEDAVIREIQADASLHLKVKLEMTEMSEDEFDERFTPIKNPFDENASWNGCIFDLFGEQVQFVLKQDESKVWTLVDGDDDDKQYLISGFHRVNRFGYIITEESHGNKTIQVEQEAV